MSSTVLVVWSDELLGYDLGAAHPMAPSRLALTVALARSLHVLTRSNVQLVPPEAAADPVLELIHDSGYMAAVRGAPLAPFAPSLARFGLGGADIPIFNRMHEAAALVVGATVQAARAVATGAAQHAVNIAGGLHHAMPSAASGFCVYNDAAVAIAELLNDGVPRVAYVDLDAHHGDGVQTVFYRDPRVLTISLHENGYTAFPGTGFPDENGDGGAAGTAVNVALPPHTGDAGWLRAFHAVVPPLLRAFQPEVLVTQLGCDSHRLDPMANLDLTVDAHRASYAALHHMAHQLTGGRWVAVGGGGYDPVQVVPRSWTHLLAEITGPPLEPHTETPREWRELVRLSTGHSAPETLTDGATPTYRGWDAGSGDSYNRLDRAVASTRRAVFPEHGLDPYDPR